MSSRSKERQEDAKLRVMQIIDQNPDVTTREIAQNIGISNGSAYHLLTSLIGKGLIKIKDLKKNTKKSSNFYILSPKGVREKSFLTNKFLIRKKQEFKLLKEEIEMFEKSVGSDFEHK
jgi:EPS-associated MarR family transcriptional regulator